MTASQLSSLGGVIKVQHQLYKLNDIDPAFFMRNVSEENSHDGFINKKLDPYKTQLRSRPRHNAKDKDHQHLIILSDADQTLVNQEIQKAMS